MEIERGPDRDNVLVAIASSTVGMNKNITTEFSILECGIRVHLYSC